MRPQTHISYLGEHVEKTNAWVCVVRPEPWHATVAMAPVRRESAIAHLLYIALYVVGRQCGVQESRFEDSIGGSKVKSVH